MIYGHICTNRAIYITVFCAFLFPIQSPGRSSPAKKITHRATETDRSAAGANDKSHRRKQPTPRRHKAGTLALREIRLYQKSTHLLLRRAPFARLTREILVNAHPLGTTFRWQQVAIECLQEAAEAYLICFLSDAYLCSLHSKRVTLMPRDFHLIKRLRGANI